MGEAQNQIDNELREANANNATRSSNKRRAHRHAYYMGGDGSDSDEASGDDHKDLKPGAQVWLRFEGFELDGLKLKGTSAKLRPRFVGPFVIKEQVSDVSFRIKLPQTKIDSGLHDVFHSRNLIVNRPNADSVLPAAHFDSNLNEELWEIEHIIAHDKHGKQNRFLIKWKGWPEVLATWISEAIFRTDAPSLCSLCVGSKFHFIFLFN